MPAVKELSPQEMEQRLAGKSGAERAAELRKLASEMEGVKVEEPAPTINMTKEICDHLFSNQVSEIKKAVTEATEQFEKKYDLSRGEANSRATEFISDEARKLSLKAEEDKIIGRRFASIMKRSLGRFDNTGEFEKAFEEEKKFLKRHYGRETLAMTVGTDSTGGYLAPELWETRLYSALAKTSLARRYATLINMGNREIMRMPKMTSGLTAYMVDEATAIPTTQPTFSQFTLQPRKCAVLTNPISIELLETGDPNVIDLLTNDAMRAFGRKEDEAVFVGSDSIFNGLMEQTVNNVYLGGSSTSGKTTIGSMTYDDLFRAYNTLDEIYTPDSDTENSGGGISGEAFYWLNKAAINTLHMLKGSDGQYVNFNTMNLMQDNKFNNFGIKRVIDLPSAPAPDTRFAAFGNLKYVYFGYRPGITIDTLKEGTVAGVNLGTTAQYSLRFIEFFDQARIDESAFSILRTSAS